jgi:hypothetical protein
MIDRWLLSYRARPIDLAVCRIIYCVFVAVLYLPNGMWLASIPETAYHPKPGLALFFTTFPPHYVILGLNVVASASLAALFAGFATPAAGLALSGSLVALNSFVYSIGKITHTILLDILPAVMAFSGWGRCLSIHRGRVACDEARPCWPLAIMAAATGVAMFTAGWAKLTTGWLDPSQHQTLHYAMSNMIGTGAHPVAAGLVAHAPLWTWKCLDYITVLFELAFLPAILSPLVFRVVLCVAAIFHLGVWLTFGIFFSHNVVVYSAFVRWRRVKDVRMSWLVLPAAVLVCGYVVTLDRPLAENLWLNQAILVIGAAIGVSYLAGIVLNRYRQSGPGSL